MKPIIVLLILLFGATPEISIGQVNQAQADDLSKLLDASSCEGNFQLGKKVCETVLSRSVDAKRNKSSDHIILRTYLITSPAEEPITTLDAVIVGAQPDRMAAPSSKDSNRQRDCARMDVKFQLRQESFFGRFSIECHRTMAVSSY